MSKFKVTIAPSLADLPHHHLAELVELQGELKDLSKREYNKLKKSISEKGIFVPFFVWPSDDTLYILDGHQRNRVLTKEGYTGLVPCLYIDAVNELDAKEKLLLISSQYGKITQEGLDTFAFDIDPDWLMDSVNFDALVVYEDIITDEEEPDDDEPEREYCPHCGGEL